MKRSALLKHLRQHGCVLKREGRSHSLWMQRTLARKEEKRARKVARKEEKRARKAARLEERVVVGHKSRSELAKAIELFERIAAGLKEGKVSVEHEDQKLTISPADMASTEAE